MATDVAPQLLISIDEAARLLSCSRSFVKRLIERGELPSLKLGASRRIRIGDLETFIARAEQTTPR